MDSAVRRKELNQEREEGRTGYGTRKLVKGQETAGDIHQPEY